MQGLGICLVCNELTMCQISKVITDLVLHIPWITTNAAIMRMLGPRTAIFVPISLLMIHSILFIIIFVSAVPMKRTVLLTLLLGSRNGIPGIRSLGLSLLLRVTIAVFLLTNILRV